MLKLRFIEQRFIVHLHKRSVKSDQRKRQVQRITHASRSKLAIVMLSVQ